MVSVACIACARDYPLPRRITCEAVLNLRIGMPEAEVIRLLGPAQMTLRDPQILKDGTEITSYAFYGTPSAPEDGGRWDTLQIGYFDNKLVRAVAQRILPDSPLHVPGSGNPRTAFVLQRDPSKPDGATRPETGPALAEIFDCGNKPAGQ